MKNQAHTLSCLQESTARLNTFMRFSRWREARGQAKLVKQLLSRCQHLSDERVEAAQASLEQLRRGNGITAQLGYLFVDLLLVLAWLMVCAPLVVGSRDLPDGLSGGPARDRSHLGRPSWQPVADQLGWLREQTPGLFRSIPDLAPLEGSDYDAVAMKSHRLEFQELEPEEMSTRATSFYHRLKTRRTVRHFSTRDVPREVVEQCLLAAGTAPSGANKQPWHFAVVTDAETKSKIREAAEAEEREFYGGRAPQEWLEALEPFGTDAHKPFLEEAPVLIAIFAQSLELLDEKKKKKNYYVTESVGIATGMLISALHWSGLATLTHTPSPMGFLREILGRPKTERPFLLLVVGYPADDTQVPVITKKSLSEISSWH